jgi:hypothetical protein
MVDKLGVPMVRMDISEEYHAEVAAKVLKLWKKRRLPILINVLCAPCKLVNREVFKIARTNDVKAVIFGGNDYEAFQFGAGFTAPGKKSHKHSFVTQLRKLMRIGVKGTSLLAKCPELIPLLPIVFKASVLYLSPHTVYLRLRYPDILRADYFSHEKYSEDECIRVITEQLGWELPEGCNSYWKADCSLAETKNLLFAEDVGATYLECYLSNMIRAGVITREEALNRLETEGKVSQERLAHAAEVLGIGVESLGQ